MFFMIRQYCIIYTVLIRNRNIDLKRPGAPFAPADLAVAATLFVFADHPTDKAHDLTIHASFLMFERL